ncbi:MAG: hypothetical protein JNK16_13970 [Phycisphaerales bacterium]|nr:hypothetical protein [Phycisphaerales bacterium]
MHAERIVIREKTWKYWLIGGPMIAPGADRFWKLHGFTRRRRAAMFWMIGILIAGAPLLFILFPLTTISPRKSSPAAMGWQMVLPGLAMFLAFRILFLPMFAYGAWFASRIRRRDGRVCWECGRDVGAGAEGKCACGEEWNADALHLFWMSCGLLPTTVRGVREARFALGGELPRPGVSIVARLLSGLPRDQMSAWQERPLTQKWLKQSMWRSTGMLLLLSLGTILAIIFAASLAARDHLWMFIGYMIALSLGMLVGQIFILRWNLRRAVRKARENVRLAEGLICTDCGFVLRGLAEQDRCPECGIEFRADELRGFFRASGILEDGNSLREEASERAGSERTS